MLVGLTQQERGIVYAALDAGPTWGGSEQGLLALDDLYSALRLADFETLKADITALSTDAEAFELTPALAETLVAVVAGKSCTLNRVGGRIAASAVRKVRAAEAPGV